MNRRHFWITTLWTLAGCGDRPSADTSAQQRQNPMNVSPSMEVIGAYAVPEAKQPVTLVEFRLKEFHGTLNFEHFNQAAASLRPGDAQSAYLEHRLNDDGTSGQDVSLQDVVVEGSGRFAFFIHYMELNQPLETPFGPVLLPPLKARPERLAFMEYDEPD